MLLKNYNLNIDEFDKHLKMWLTVFFMRSYISSQFSDFVHQQLDAVCSVAVD